MNTKVAKKNNNGFTLIELIVVIAIIAVLAAILAPQYLRYVEKSRESADVQAAVEIINASKTAAAEEKVYNQIVGANTAGIKVEWDAGSTGTGTKTAPALKVEGKDVSATDVTADNNPLAFELNKTIDLTDYKSKAYRSNQLHFTLKAENDKVEVTIQEQGTDANTKKWTDNESLSKYKEPTK